MSDEYEPTWESLDEHPAPEWFHDAKLGIFIHWGVYSVPAYADPEGDHAYAEWYPYYMYETGSDTAEYHRETYGADVEYADFIADWTAEHWDPERWADFFSDVGARYVVLTAEHHDGFPLWDTHYTSYNAAEMGPERDLVGELCEAVRDRGLRFGGSYHANLNYYQPGFDGRFGHPDFEGADGDFRSDDAGPGAEYVDFMNAKHRELIRRYDPDLLWFDVPCAESEHLEAKELVADFYNRAAAAGTDVAVNDRAATDGNRAHGDFYTPEYDAYDEITEFKWEACRGIGHSFGYNAAETADHHLSGEELVHSFVDIVSKNGNLLINVGPRADGTIPDLQREPLETLGAWLGDHGEAIYGTRPWTVAEDGASDVAVRYTRGDGTLYATCLSWPGEELRLAVGEHADLDRLSGARLLATDRDLPVDADGSLTVDLSAESPPDRPAHTVALDGLGTDPA
jgi:alpha-L-fucosidase